MLINIFQNNTTSFNTSSLLIATIVSLSLGLLIAYTHKLTSKYTKGFLTAIIILPFLIFMVIVLVNGSLDTVVAIMGVFSLVRFRS